MTDWTIRATEKSDAAALARLLNEASYRHGTLRLPFETVGDVESHHFAGGQRRLQLVAEQGEDIVGFAGLWRWPGRRDHCGLVGLGVAERMQGKGVGTDLLRTVVDYADNWLGLRRLELTVNVDNEHAIRLYSRFGFETEGRERQSILRAGVLVDSFAMARLRDAPPPLSAVPAS